MSDLKVTLYSDSEYRGSSTTLAVGRYPTNIGLKNDALSSLKIPTGLKVTICENSQFEGRRCILVRDTPHLNGANDAATSLIIETDPNPGVIVYSDSNFQGWSAEVGVGSQAAIGAGNDLVSSVIVPSGYRVTLYSDGPFKGKTLELTQDAASLNDFNDRASSIIVDRLTDQAPTLEVLNQIIKKVAPRVYVHPDDEYGPSSVEWFLKSATLHKSDGTASSAASTQLPAGGSDDHSYWLVGGSGTRGGDLGSAVAYVNAKLQNHWLDIQFWFFYPYNGAGSAKITVVDVKKTIGLDPMGQHGGDWEHVTCRVDPVTQELRAVYMAQHSGGVWFAKGDIAMENGRPVAYSSRHGHASYPGTGTNLSNGTSQKWASVTWFEFGLVNSTDKSAKVLDCSNKYQLLRADFLSSGITAPSWTQFCHRWGPHITYQTSDLKNSIKSQLGSIPYAGDATDAIWDALPDEFKEEDGPTGPWMKGAWKGKE